MIVARTYAEIAAIAALLLLFQLLVVKALVNTRFWVLSLLPVFLLDALPKLFAMTDYFLSLGHSGAFSVVAAGFGVVGSTIYAVYSSLLFVFSRKPGLALLAAWVGMLVVYFFDRADLSIADPGLLGNWVSSSAGGLVLLVYFVLERRVIKSSS